MMKKVLAMVALTLSMHSHAAFVHNLTYSTDTANNIDYLHLDQTFGYSYYQVVHQDVLGFIAEGWQVASQEAVERIERSDRIRFDRSTGVEYIITNNNLYGGQSQDTGAPEDEIVLDDWDRGGFNYTPWVGAAPSQETQSVAAVLLSRPVSQVPVPAAAWLFGSALIGLAGIKRK